MAGDRERLRAGAVVAGRYRLERIVGKGGMGVVFAARHLELGHRVAIKILANDAAPDEDQVARFLREARAAARLSSEHVTRVTDFGRLDGGTPFIAMEFLDGEDLARRLARGPLSIAESVDYVLQTCEAIAEAHARGMVHRDLKPQNIFLTKRPHGPPLVKVLDFGIAKVPSNEADRALTTAAEVMGSIAYMSPEQLRSARDADARADIWSLGVCLYELLCGRVPFEDPSVPVLCAKILTTQPVPVSAIRPDVPETLAGVVERCLLKDRELRYPTILDLAGALEPFGSAAARGAARRVQAIELAAGAEDAPVDDFDGSQAAVSGDTRTEAAIDATSPIGRGIRPVVVALLAGGVTLAIGIALLAVQLKMRHAPTLSSAGASAQPTIQLETLPRGPNHPADSAATTVAPLEPPPVAAETPTSMLHGRAASTANPPARAKSTKGDAGLDPSARF